VQVRNAAINIVITAVYERTTSKYGELGIRYVHFEVGRATQNVLLQATALDLGAVSVGAFYSEVKKLLNLSREEPLYIVSIGRKPNQPNYKKGKDIINHPNYFMADVELRFEDKIAWIFAGLGDECSEPEIAERNLRCTFRSE